MFIECACDLRCPAATSASFPARFDQIRSTYSLLSTVDSAVVSKFGNDMREKKLRGMALFDMYLVVIILLCLTMHQQPEIQVVVRQKSFHPQGPG